MIKNFQLLIHQVLDNVELNEKTFRDRGSGFVMIEYGRKQNYEKIIIKKEDTTNQIVK